MNTPVTRKNLGAPRGFSLVEMLFAIGILAVGLISVAALIPVGGVLQRASFDDVMGQELASNAEAIVRARGVAVEEFDSSIVATSTNVKDLARYNNADFDPVAAVAPKLLNDIDYLPTDRSLATFQPAAVGVNISPNITDRPFEFVFVAQRHPSLGPQVYVLVCRRSVSGGLLTPKATTDAWTVRTDAEDKTRSILTLGSDSSPLPLKSSKPPNHLNKFPVGSMVLDDQGNVYTILRSAFRGGTALGSGYAGNPQYLLKVTPPVPAAVGALWYVENESPPKSSYNPAPPPPAPAQILRVLRFGSEVLR